MLILIDMFRAGMVAKASVNAPKPKPVSYRMNSQVDRSVNWVWMDRVESRVVPKNDRVSVYVSSQSGCNQGCKFCWLTATKQTSFRHVDITRYAEQVDTALAYIREQDGVVPRVNINFMARGEPLMNRYVVNQYPQLEETLNGIVYRYTETPMKINISTIMPRGFQRRLIDTFHPTRNPDTILPHLYYSVYSMDAAFRRKWIPSAMDPQSALDLLREYNEATPSIPVTFHFALIAGENDSLESIADILKAIRVRDFRSYKFNIVRFNPPPGSSYVESPEPQIKKIFAALQEYARDDGYRYSRSRIVPRAGPDVYASCGMFVDFDAV